MAGTVALRVKSRPASHRPIASTTEAAWARWLLISFAVAFIGLFLVMPLILIFVYAFWQGVGAYFAAFTDRDALSAIRLTLITAAIAVPLNTLFGVAAAWAIAKFEFKGKNVLITLIDLPFAISPIIAGLIFVILFGARGWLGPWLIEPSYPWPTWIGFAQSFWPLVLDWGPHPRINIIFAVPGIVLATMFVTFPFVARELIPLMQAQGTEEEQSALTLGASGWKTFLRVTLPNIKWGLLYGVILTNARAMGEFGAVSVVSGHIRGKTNTMPLHIEVLYNDYQTTASFAVASLLAFLAVLTLVIKSVVEWRSAREHAAAVRLAEAGDAT